MTSIKDPNSIDSLYSLHRSIRAKTPWGRILLSSEDDISARKSEIIANNAQLNIPDWCCPEFATQISKNPNREAFLSTMTIYNIVAEDFKDLPEIFETIKINVKSHSVSTSNCPNSICRLQGSSADFI